MASKSIHAKGVFAYHKPYEDHVSYGGKNVLGGKWEKIDPVKQLKFVLTAGSKAEL